MASIDNLVEAAQYLKEMSPQYAYTMAVERHKRTTSREILLLILSIVDEMIGEERPGAKALEAAIDKEINTILRVYE